jgi:hypothetical protein
VSTRFAAVSLCVSLAIACGPRPVELGFWMAPISYQPVRIGEAITPAEYTTIDQTARLEIVNAFRDFEVTVTANRSARFKVEVVPSLADQRLIRSGTHAGESRAVAGFGGAGHVSFEYVANGAMVFAPDDATRPEIIAALGRGVGRVAIHEFLHQLLPKSPIHDSRDGDSYEGNSPAQLQGYFGDLHWGIARPWLEARVKRKSST